jgi:periplasmic protein CpxP/Spy
LHGPAARDRFERALFHCRHDINRYAAIRRRKDAAGARPDDGGLFNPGPVARPTAKEPLMKTWIKRTLIGLVGASAIFGGLAAWAHNSHYRHGWHAMSAEDAAAMKARVIDRVGSHLDLDAAQKARLGVLADKLREQRNALVGNAADPRAELQGLVAGNTFDRARASALIQEKLGAVNAKSPEVVTAMADFYDSLRPEQQARLREFMARRGQGHRDDRG